jgi:NADP-dependent 3-hydroxy acid dehydrogenase YdfG
MSNNIEGKIVVITGASSGLGEATARLLSGQAPEATPNKRVQDDWNAPYTWVSHL